jgi:hypothetical protein
LEVHQRRKKGYFGKEGMHGGSDSWKEEQPHTCMEDITILGLGFLQYIVMDGEPETYKYGYLSLIENKMLVRK